MLVVSYHATTVDYGIIDGRGYEIFNYIIRAFLSAGVPLFFFANGFLLMNRPFELKKHVIKLMRIIILTVVWAAINVVSLMLIRILWAFIFYI